MLEPDRANSRGQVGVLQPQPHLLILAPADVVNGTNTGSTIKEHLNERTCVRLTCILRVADCERALLDLFFKQVFLIEEEDDGGVCEPLVVADGVEQLHTLVHSILKGSPLSENQNCASLH